MTFGAIHRRRLREVYRSAGWPCLDAIEIELLAAGLLERVRSARRGMRPCASPTSASHSSPRPCNATAGRDPHELLVERVAREMTRAGRIVWRGLSLRAKVGRTWSMAMPDVFSIRHTTVEAYLEPVVHEVKVSRADLLSDLRSVTKRAAYLQLSSECWYVIRAGIGGADDIPPECGVLVATETALEVARPAPKRAMTMPFGLWMALARATPLEGWQLDEAQGQLGDTSACPPET